MSNVLPITSMKGVQFDMAENAAKISGDYLIENKIQTLGYYTFLKPMIVTIDADFIKVFSLC